ncbi:hypothetical protein Mlute_00536 [Meiothermus luteus]|uniref:Uncharacterized protein n=1 Tax=Meiothermus luteus TaxID=2026184 RepID=A0A399EXL2_9DEIN|nr:DUF11 domain-containing protein [Meiothermus luteus]RIH88748.1 hypothetical protein Mlute_00536 [Meiothermus luteus]
MKRLLFFLLALALGLAQAQVVRSFTNVFNSNTTGNIVVIGNTLMTCDNSTVTPSNPPNCNTSDTSLSNNLSMVFVDFDGDGSTPNSSRATLSLPTGAQVLFAGLYWGARADPSSTTRNQIRFRPPGSSYQTLTADWLETITTQGAATSRPYAAFRDVTSLVQAAGSGDYWVANITALTGNDDLGFYAGWSLVVVYQHPTEPLRRLTVAQGLAVVSNGNNVTQTVSGLLTPAVGAVEARIGAVAWEGDAGITGDQLQIRPTGATTWASLSDGQNPANNFFNSSVSALGSRFTNKNPDYVNQFALDADVVQYNNLPNSTTSIDLQFTSTQDVYFPQVLTFAVNIYAPNLTTTFTKTVNDLNGGNVLVGDVLEYTISFTNTGGDGATNVVVRDPIPAGTQYVPGSLQVLSNAAAAPTGTFTDASGDDIAEYATACSELSGSPPCVRFRLGTGANATQGGLILPSQGASVRFRVQVLPSAAGTTLTNTAQVSYNGQTLGTAFNQSASATASASVPTPPSLSKAFSPGSIPVGGTSTLTLTLTNPNASPATLTAALVDNLPSGLVVASPAGTATTCPSGTVTANPGSSTVSLGNGAQIPANGSCTVSVNVTGSAPGSYTNTLPAGALQTNQGNNTTAASATLSILGASLSGRVYADQEPNGMAEPSEGWSGPTVYVNLVQGGSVVQSVAVSAGSGAYTFSAVPPGSYTLVVATTPTATTPAAPTGWLFVNPAGSRSIAMSGSSLAGQDFGLFNGSRIRGTVFRDDGQGSGTANNALQDGGEPGIPNVLVTASSGTNSRSAYTDANGLYTLFIPASFGSSLTLSHPQQPATGSNVGGSSVSLAASYGAPAAASRTIGSFAAGQYYEGYNFGVARESRLSPDQSGQTTSPGTITYAHLFRPGTLGSVSLGATGGGFTYRLRRDANCDGDFDDPGEGFVAPPLGFSVDATWPREPDGSPRACAVELEVQVPGGVPHGSVDLVQLNLSLTWANNPSVVEAKRLVDTTTILPPGGLSLTKEVRNVTQGTPFARSGAGRPGEVLEYCIAYQNLGSQPITGVVLTDPIPFFTLYQAGSLRLGGTPLTEAADSDPGEVSGGVVRVQIGNLAAGAGGSVCYRVQVK